MPSKLVLIDELRSLIQCEFKKTIVEKDINQLNQAANTLLKLNSIQDSMLKKFQGEEFLEEGVNDLLADINSSVNDTEFLEELKSLKNNPNQQIRTLAQNALEQFDEEGLENDVDVVNLTLMRFDEEDDDEYPLGDFVNQVVISRFEYSQLKDIHKAEFSHESFLYLIENNKHKLSEAVKLTADTSAMLKNYYVTKINSSWIINSFSGA